jgi:hypothetical protein
MKTEFWILGAMVAVGKGQRRNAISKKISNQESSHTWKIGTITLGKENCSNPQIWLFRKNYCEAI